MAIKTASTTLNGKTLSIVLLKSLDGIRMSQQLSKVAIPAITALQSTGDMVHLANAVVTSLDEIELDKIITKIFEGSTVDSGDGAFPINVDNYFAGNYGELVSFLTFALRANFESFFSVENLSALFTSNQAA